MKKLKKKLLIFLIPVLLIPLVMQFSTGTTSALSGSQFKAGNIISDALFYKSKAMSRDQIQSFLNSKVPNCDTNGTKPYGGTTRGQYGTSKGYPPPYYCLKDKRMSTPSKSSNSYCKAYPGGTYKASRIIYEVGKACGISQKVLLVMLEKEQSLVTDDWPWSVQYRKAMGYGCPDTAPCDSQYYGLFNQLYNAARQFKRYKQNGELFNYRSDRRSYVQWHPNAGCGGSYVTMKNHATAGLYNYTPYRPNQAALNNLYGTGNGCSSYGNRNFWRIYSNWFGSTHPRCTSSDRTGTNVFRLFNVKNGKRFLTAMECEANTLDVYTSFKLEDVAFEQAPGSADKRTGVYRLLKGKKRFWTASVSERNRLVNKHGYKLEGTAFIVLKGSSTTDKKPVYRLHNHKVGSHLWTPSEGERDRVKRSKDWRYEGVAYYTPS